MYRLDCSPQRRPDGATIPARSPSSSAAGCPVTWKINSEVVLLLGWGRAILLQLAHPLVAAGVADHSSFTTRPSERLRRLQRTLGAMFALTFGPAETAERAALSINTIHDRVHGHLRDPAGAFPAGTAYSAHDPALLCWVHATLLDSFARTYELFIAPLTSQEKDRYCREASGIASLLGIPADALPMSWAELQVYMNGMYASGQVAVTDIARRLARDVLAPPCPPPALPLVWLLRLTTLGLLPPAIREAYGFRWDLRRERLLHNAASFVRYALPFLPSLLRHWPAARNAWNGTREQPAARAQET